MATGVTPAGRQTTASLLTLVNPCADAPCLTASAVQQRTCNQRSLDRLPDAYVVGDRQPTGARRKPSLLPGERASLLRSGPETAGAPLTQRASMTTCPSCSTST